VAYQISTGPKVGSRDMALQVQFHSKMISAVFCVSFKLSPLDHVIVTVVFKYIFVSTGLQ